MTNKRVVAMTRHNATHTRTAIRMQYTPNHTLPPFLHDTGLEITSVLPLPFCDCFIEGQPQPPVLHRRCPDQGVDVQQYPHLQTDNTEDVQQCSHLQTYNTENVQQCSHLQTFAELTFPARVCYHY